MPARSALYWVPARKIRIEADDGLAQPWHGWVFVDPSFGGRPRHMPWLTKFLDYANGVAMVRADTSAGWFHEFAAKVRTLPFRRGKSKFIYPDGSIGASPGRGLALLGIGAIANAALRQRGLGLFVPLAADAIFLGAGERAAR